VGLPVPRFPLRYRRPRPARPRRERSRSKGRLTETVRAGATTRRLSQSGAAGCWRSSWSSTQSRRAPHAHRLRSGARLARSVAVTAKTTARLSGVRSQARTGSLAAHDGFKRRGHGSAGPARRLPHAGQDQRFQNRFACVRRRARERSPIEKRSPCFGWGSTGPWHHGWRKPSTCRPRDAARIPAGRRRSGKLQESSPRRVATPAYHRALSLRIRRWVAKSTCTIPKRWA
jgi:hypothetical protein